MRVLCQRDLSREGGEQEHDGEAGQQAGVLDSEGDERTGAPGLLLLTTHLVHLWELSGRGGEGGRGGGREREGERGREGGEGEMRGR